MQRIYYEGKRQNKSDKSYAVGSDLDLNGWIIKPSGRRFLRADYQDRLKKNEMVYFNESIFDLHEKIVWRQTSDRIRAAILPAGWFANTLQAGILKDNRYNIRYVLALLNSKFLNYLYTESVREGGRVFPQVKLSKIKSLPFRVINFSDKSDRAKYDQICSLAENVINFKSREMSLTNQNEKVIFHRQIISLENQIDQLIYDLYGLTKSEIKIAEENASLD